MNDNLTVDSIKCSSCKYSAKGSTCKNCFDCTTCHNFNEKLATCNCTLNVEPGRTSCQFYTED